MRELPESKAVWRSNFAVPKYWNKNGQYVEYTVKEDGLPVWEGKVATQLAKDKDGVDIESWIVKGGGNQLFSPNALEDIPNDLPVKLTPWSQ